MYPESSIQKRKNNDM